MKPSPSNPHGYISPLVHFGVSLFKNEGVECTIYVHKFLSISQSLKIILFFCSIGLELYFNESSHVKKKYKKMFIHNIRWSNYYTTKSTHATHRGCNIRTHIFNSITIINRCENAGGEKSPILVVLRWNWVWPHSGIHNIAA
jgi:hypothetical protein